MEKFISNFYGRTRGKGLSSHKEELLKTLLPQFKFSFKKLELLSSKYDKIVLDIGFGQGESTFYGAKNNPDTLYVGVELFVNGYANLLSLIEADRIETGAELENILIANVDAVGLLEKLPDNFFDRVQLLFPDPWHKKRHNKRRFVSVRNLLQIERVVKKSDGNCFRFVSDIDDYNFWTLMMISKVESFSIKYDNLHSYEAEPDGWYQTKYQKKASREGRRPLFFDFKITK